MGRLSRVWFLNSHQSKYNANAEYNLSNAHTSDLNTLSQALDTIIKPSPIEHTIQNLLQTYELEK